MKRFVEVQEFRSGRVFTRIYPARSAGSETVWANYVDPAPCLCGYAVCSRSGPCAPPPLAPVDVLPEGWRKISDGYYGHESRAAVRRDLYVWSWWAAAQKEDPGAKCIDPKPTRNEAMTAALASVQPAQPELRPGWVLTSVKDTYCHPRCPADVYRRPEGSVNRWLYPWRVVGDSNHPTLEAACLRAEELAELEGSR